MSTYSETFLTTLTVSSSVIVSFSPISPVPHGSRRGIPRLDPWGTGLIGLNETITLDETVKVVKNVSLYVDKSKIIFDVNNLDEVIEIPKHNNSGVMTTSPESILLQDLNVNQFTKNYLKAEGIETTQDLELIEKRKLIGLGMKNIDRLRDELEKHDLDFDLTIPF